MAKEWKKVQRADSAFAGDVTGSVNGTAVGNVFTTANKPSADDVGLGNVTNESKATMFASPTFTGTATGLSKASVGLGNVDNSLFTSAGKFKGGITKSDGTSIFDPSTGNFTGKIDGSNAKDVKDNASNAKDAVDGNATITMVGGSLSIGTASGGIYPFSVDSSGNLKIQDDEFQALADGTVNCKGSFTINQDSSSNSRITLAGSGSGTAEVEVQGANPTFDLGGTTPLGTSTMWIKRTATNNQARLYFRTGNSGTDFGIGVSNDSPIQTQYAIHTGGLWSSGTNPERCLSFDADGKMGMYANSKTVDGFTFGSDGTNKNVYIKDGGLSIGTTSVSDGDLRCSEVITSSDIYCAGDFQTTGQSTFEDTVQFDAAVNIQGTTNCDGTLDASGQQALTGWHTKDYIWVVPGQFTINDDNAYGNLGMEGNGGQAKVMYSSLEAYAQIPIPSGYKATKFRINGTASVTVTCSYSTIGVGTVTSCQPPANCLTNTEHSMYQTAVNADDTNGRYIVLGWHPSTTSQYLYGAYIKIEKI